MNAYEFGARCSFAFVCGEFLSGLFRFGHGDRHRVAGDALPRLSGASGTLALVECDFLRGPLEYHRASHSPVLIRIDR